MIKTSCNIFLIAFLGLLTLQIRAQCSLLFLKAPDSLCANSKELVLRTSQVANAEYVWRLPNQDSVITRDSFLVIAKPQAIHSGNYSVLAKTATCRSAVVGTVNVVILGQLAQADTVKKRVVCGVREIPLISAFKVENGIVGEWLAITEGVNFSEKKTERTTVKGLNAGENTVVWSLSTEKCKDFLQDTFKIWLEEAPRMSNQAFTLRAQDASLFVPLGRISGSNLDLIQDAEIRIDAHPKNGTLTIVDKALKYARKAGFRGSDRFSVVICNKKCQNLCSPPTPFDILVEYNELFPNVTIPKILSPQQTRDKGFVIENVDNYPENELLILDRWGGVVVRFFNYKNSATWDGTNNGKLLSAGAYYFVFTAKQDSSTPPRTNFKPLTGIFYIIE